MYPWLLIGRIRIVLFKQILKRYLIASVMVISLQACVSNTVPSDMSVAAKQESIPIKIYPEFGSKPKLITEEKIFELAPAQVEDFQKFLRHPSNKNLAKNKLVSKYLEKMIKGFNYHSNTYIASESAAKNSGNCLSLGILTTALAKIADVEVGYELMRTPPVYQKKGNTILSSQHVRSLLFEPTLPEEGFVFILRPVLKIDYFPTFGSIAKRRVQHSEFVSMYFRNMAAEAIIDNRLIDAFWLARHSMEFAENNAHATNMIALIYDRLGYSEDAEKLYLYGLRYADEKLELLSNYHKYLLRNQRVDEAEEIKGQIADLNIPDPFDWLDLADEALAANNLGEALDYYNKVIELAPYLHYGFSGLGKVEFLKGNHRRAKEAFSKAAELALESETRAAYRAKLSALTAL